MKFHLRLLFPAAVIILLALDEAILAQTTAFTYQGKLTDHSTPASGTYDFTFSLFDVASAGNPLGGMLTNPAVQVVAGAFSVSLDFGTNFPGADRWIEITVRTNGDSTFTPLTPRQKITSTPYAITAASLSGSISSSQLGSLTNHADVGTVGLAPGQILVYNGTVWTNALFGSSTTGVSPVTLAYSGTNVPVNAATGTHFRLIATNSFLLQNPTGAADGQRLLFELIQDATGGRTMALGTAYKLGLDLPVINLTTNANGRDFITCISSGTNIYVVGFIKGF